MFRRRRSEKQAPEAQDAEAVGEGVGATPEPAFAGTDPALGGLGDRGPWDVSQVDEPSGGGTRIDLGGMWLPGAEGMEVRVEVDQDTGAVAAVTAVLGESALQAQPFAAPRTAGIWDDVRTDVAESILEQGGQVLERDGALGAELLAQVPVQLPDGTVAAQVVRFLGVDGPRWFLRGVLTGEAAVDDDAAEVLLAVFSDIVVVRGNAPMARGDLIPLRLPAEAGPVSLPPTGVDAADSDGSPGFAAAGSAGADDDPDASGQRPPLQPFERGPEITEIR